MLRLNPTTEKESWHLLPIERFEVMQYTGLTDKNGVEVFEGDIVIDSYENRQQIVFGKIGYDSRWNGLTGFGFKNDDYDFIELQWHNDPKLIEVIGNIHQNPELLNQ